MRLRRDLSTSRQSARRFIGTRGDRSAAKIATASSQVADTGHLSPLMLGTVRRRCSFARAQRGRISGVATRSASTIQLLKLLNSKAPNLWLPDESKLAAKVRVRTSSDPRRARDTHAVSTNERPNEIDLPST